MQYAKKAGYYMGAKYTTYPPVASAYWLAVPAA